MLRHLHICNYALIDEVDLHFSKGMTAITGETGSGKSILLGAFGLLLGERAVIASIKNAEEKCVVEAEFDISNYGLQHFFETNDLDYESYTHIRREVNASGKSRAFINDTPVQLQALRALSSLLVDIHSQHENSLLSTQQFQLDTVDTLAGNQKLLDDYRTLFVTYTTKKKWLEEAIQNEQRLKQELDYLQFQLRELQAADLEKIDQHAMEQQLETLNHAEQIKQQLIEAVSTMGDEKHGLLLALAKVRSGLQKMSGLNNTLQEFAQRTEACYIELRELMRELEGYENLVQIDEKHQAQISEKLSLLYHLEQKHGMKGVADLLALLQRLEAKCADFENMDERIAATQTEVDSMHEALLNKASSLTKTRVKAKELVQSEAERYFKSLQLSHAQLKVTLEPAHILGENGSDLITFLFSANKGGALQPLKQVASGGEVARLMLALKAAIASHKKLPLLILDEIDQGISGEVAMKTGEVLSGISTNMQLLVITHLPQIAGKAAHHIKVSKHVSDNATTTRVQPIAGEERINELAEMLSGKTLTKAAIANARELMVR
ncbi:MAG: DNA repair protein RecN [Flavobacteriales bacterium]